MNALTILFIAIVFIIGVWMFVTAPRHLKIPALLFICLAYAGIYGGLASVMGKARPILIPDERVRVIAFHFQEPDWIYIWVAEKEPVALRLPWSTEQARQLRQAMEEAREGRSELMMQRGVPEGERMFYPAPPPEYPPKQQ